MEEENIIFDVIIVGSGWGGLMSSIILAKQGFKVLVLEKNRQFGGALQTFSFQKELFDSCVHYIGSMDPGATQYQIFKYLEVLNDLEIERLKEDGFDKIYWENEELGQIPQGFHTSKLYFIEKFPHEALAIKEYFSLIQEVVDHFPLYSLNYESENRKTQYLEIPLLTKLEALFKDEKLIQLLMGNAFLYNGQKKTTPFYEHALIMFSYWQGAVKFKKGSSELTRSALKVLRKYHAICIKNQSVKQVEKKNNLFYVHTGTHLFKGRKVIYNGSLKTFPNLFSKNILPKRWLKRITQAQTSMSCFMIHALVDQKSLPYSPQNIYWNKSDINTYELLNHTQWPINFAIYFNEDKANPSWSSSITILAYINPSVFSDFNKKETLAENEFKILEKEESYSSLKETLAQTLLKSLNIYFPEIYNSLTEYKVATPVTLQQYLNYPEGSMYGVMKDASFIMKETFLTRSPLEGLWLTGQDIGMHGILGVSITSLVTCMQLMDLDHPESFLKQIREA